jgi:hypothetical protein
MRLPAQLRQASLLARERHQHVVRADIAPQVDEASCEVSALEVPPQLVLDVARAFSVGFPVTLRVGLLGMLLTLPALQGRFTMTLERLLSYFQ